MQYLETGETVGLADLGYPVVGPADEEARRLERPAEIVGRLIADLEQLLGTSETVTRIREWQKEFAEHNLSAASSVALCRKRWTQWSWGFRRPTGGRTCITCV